jgi:hypothetical protein
MMVTMRAAPWLLPLTLLPLSLLACQGAPAPVQPALVDRSLLDDLAPSSRAAAMASPVPVLLFAGEWSARSIVTSGAGFYAISAREGELTLSLHATNVVHHPGDGSHARREHEVRGQPALVLVNEGIRSVTWSEGAVSYAVEVECARPFEDPRCTEDLFVLGIANALVEAR